MKVLTVIGARPQFIKAAPVSAALETAGVNEVLVHTGQHYDQNMSDIFFDELGIRLPHHNLGIGSGLHGYQTGRIMEALEAVIIEEQPDCVLIYGDTNSTLAGAVVAAKLHIPVAHVEAGLRSFNRNMPEEINRVIADHVSEMLFAPTDVAVRNLLREGIAESAIHQVGDVMLDASRLFAERANARSKIAAELDLSSRNFVLATIHRAENTDSPSRLAAILDALTAVCREIKVVFPMHPRTRSRVDSDALARFAAAGGRLLDPIGYLDMIALEKNAAVIVSDSGGVQKEAFFYRTPCVIPRDETEWTELLDLGWNELVPPQNAEAIRRAVLGAIGKSGAEGAPYGDGQAAKSIVERLMAARRQPGSWSSS